MATIKFLNSKGKYQDEQAVNNVITYILQDVKTPNKVIGGYGLDLTAPVQGMEQAALIHGKNTGVRLRHFVISFHPSEISGIGHLRAIGNAVAAMIGLEYCVVFALHEDTDFPHIHFVFSAVGYSGERYRGDKQSHNQLKCSVRSILWQHGIRICYEIKYRVQDSNGDE